ncbi:MAG TPA: hypothetical protein VFB55_00350 [Verrucomicrobiae bacterium]|nr:hypothetical protein [Verrucomicrobiae bacterium]
MKLAGGGEAKQLPQRNNKHQRQQTRRQKKTADSRRIANRGRILSQPGCLLFHAMPDKADKTTVNEIAELGKLAFEIGARISNPAPFTRPFIQYRQLISKPTW